MFPIVYKRHIYALEKVAYNTILFPSLFSLFVIVYHFPYVGYVVLNPYTGIDSA